MGSAYTICCEWDEEAEVWHVASSNVPGLMLDAPTIGAMTSMLQDAIPRALDARGIQHEPVTPFELIPGSQHMSVPYHA
jgi:hypothetical protein